MKITYERLNQIIEEEVVKFKSLNEQINVSDTTKLVSAMTDATKLKTALTMALTHIKDPDALKSISNYLSGK